MSPHDIAGERVATPLSEATHKTRGKLLVASATGIVIFHTGLVPEKIEGLGITFNSGQQNAMLFCLLGLIAFLLVSFTISAISDVASIRIQRKGNLESALLNVINEAVEKGKEGNQQANAWYSAKQAVSSISKQLNISPRAVTFISRIRFVWDAVLPIAVALYSITALIVFLNHSVTR